MSQKSGKSQGILKRQVYELQKISRIKTKAFSSCLKFANFGLGNLIRVREMSGNFA